MKIQKFQKGKVVINAFEALGDLLKKGDLKVKRPRVTTTVKKQPTIGHERVEYTPPTRLTAEEKRIYNAFQKYKGTGVYATMPEDQAWALFKQDWAFRHDPTRIAVKDLHRTINHQDMISGVTTPDWMRDAMVSAVKINPSALRTDIPGTLPIKWYPNYKSNPAISSIPDYFKPQQYRGIGNYDTMFENAQHAYLSGAPETAQQFLSAGMKDVAAMARGLKPTSFKYKPAPGIVPMPVLQEIVTRRGAPAGTAQWLHNINLQDPTIGTSYLDLFAKRPSYFRQMYNLNGTPVK